MIESQQYKCEESFWVVLWILLTSVLRYKIIKIQNEFRLNFGGEAEIKSCSLYGEIINKLKRKLQFNR